MSCRTALAIAAALLVSAEGFNAPGVKGGFGAALVRGGGDSSPTFGWHGNRRQVNMAAKKKAFEVSEWASDFEEEGMWQDEASRAKQERDAKVTTASPPHRHRTATAHLPTPIATTNHCHHQCHHQCHRHRRPHHRRPHHLTTLTTSPPSPPHEHPRSNRTRSFARRRPSAWLR